MNRGTHRDTRVVRDEPASRAPRAGASELNGRGNEDQDCGAALLTAIAAGDAAALDERYRRFRPVTFAAAYALLRDPHVAEHPVHDAFLRVWRAGLPLGTVKGRVRLRPRRLRHGLPDLATTAPLAVATGD